jgi:large subunit ribosomal protein L29
MATAKEFSELNDEELGRRVVELRQGRFDKRLQHRIGELQNSAELGNNRRDLARALTVQRARQIKIELAALAAKKAEAAKKAPTKKAAAAK